jgi:hypothetical protein
MDPLYMPKEIHQTIVGFLLDADSASVISLMGVSKYWWHLGLASLKHVSPFSLPGFPFGASDKHVDTAVQFLARLTPRWCIPEESITSESISSSFAIRRLPFRVRSKTGSSRSIIKVPTGQIPAGLLVHSPDRDVTVSVSLVGDAPAVVQPRYILAPTIVPRWHCYLLVRMSCNNQTLTPTTLLHLTVLGIECSDAKAKLSVVFIPST